MLVKGEIEIAAGPSGRDRKYLLRDDVPGIDTPVNEMQGHARLGPGLQQRPNRGKHTLVFGQP